MSVHPQNPLIINGWTIYAHPLFLDQLESLIADVESLREENPQGYLKKNAAKRLAAVVKLAFELIPQDPHRPEYRQGKTLGTARKHWFRAKFLENGHPPEDWEALLNQAMSEVKRMHESLSALKK